MKRDKLKLHIKNKYYKNDKKVITLNLDNEMELYNKFDYTKETLSNDITSYLESNTEVLLPLSDITIEIKSKDSIDIEKFKKCLKLHYAIEELNANRLNKLALRKKIILFLITVIAFIVAYYSKGALNEIFYFIGTLSIWELCDIVVFEEDEDKIREYIYEILEDADVIKSE